MRPRNLSLMISMLPLAAMLSTPLLAQDAADAQQLAARRARQTPPAPGKLDPNCKVEVLTIQNVDAVDLSQIIQQFAAAMGEAVFIASDSSTNRLVVGANSDAVLAKLEDLIKSLDKPADTVGPQKVIESIILQHSNAHELGGYLIDLTRMGSRGAAPRISIVPDARTNTLWVSGDSDDVRRVVEVAQKMDAIASRADSNDTGPTAWRHYRLQHTSATETSAVINELLKISMSKARVVPDSSSNSLLTSAAEADDARIAELVQLLDVPADKKNSTGSSDAPKEK